MLKRSVSFLLLVAIVSYKDYAGRQKVVTISGAERYGNAAGRYGFTFDGLLAEELHSVVSVQVCSGNVLYLQRCNTAQTLMA